MKERGESKLPSCTPWLSEEDRARLQPPSHGGGMCTIYYRNRPDRQAHIPASQFTTLQERSNPGKVKITTTVIPQGVHIQEKPVAD